MPDTDIYRYCLSCFLCDFLSLLVPNFYSWKDTFSFVCQIKNGNFYGKFFVAYNSTSFLTNILLQESINAEKNIMFHHNPNLNITKKEHKNLFLFATSQPYFLFNSKFYNQVELASIGSPVAPVFTKSHTSNISQINLYINFLNFQSFTSFSFKISLSKCFTDRSFKIFNNWSFFHNCIESIKSNRIKIHIRHF